MLFGLEVMVDDDNGGGAYSIYEGRCVHALVPLQLHPTPTGFSPHHPTFGFLPPSFTIIKPSNHHPLEAPGVSS